MSVNPMRVRICSHTVFKSAESNQHEICRILFRFEQDLNDSSHTLNLSNGTDVSGKFLKT
jgi:hypothetical protein